MGPLPAAEGRLTGAGYSQSFHALPAVVLTGIKPQSALHGIDAESLAAADPARRTA